MSTKVIEVGIDLAESISTGTKCAQELARLPKNSTLLSTCANASTVFMFVDVPDVKGKTPATSTTDT